MAHCPAHTDAAISAQCSCPNVLIELRSGLVRVQRSCPHVVIELRAGLVRVQCSCPHVMW